MRFGALLAFLSASAFGQSNFATIDGRVEDSSRAPVSGVRIEVRSKGTGAVRTAATNDAGLFEVASLTPAEYTVEASAPGFAPVLREVTIEVGQHMTLDFTLAVSEKRETVSVLAVAESLKTQDVSLGEVIEPKSVQELPLNGRSLLDLALTVPGAHEGHGAQTGDMNPLYWRPGQRSAITIGGNRPNANYFLLDGATNTDPTFNTANFGPSPDAVQEFQVQTGSYSAEMGGAGGGQINIITRQGTTNFHGTAYEFLRNSALDARTWNEMPGTTHLVQNNFGAALGGPVYGKRTFFFVNFEGFRHTEAQTMVDTVPTQEEAGGDFSQSGVTIYNPFSSHKNPNYDPNRPVSPSNPQVIREPFPGNVIPNKYLNQSALRMAQGYLPQPNTMDMGSMTMMGTPTVFGTNQDSNNYLDVRNMHHSNNQGTIRVDRMIGTADTLNARYSISKEDGFMPENLPGFGFDHDNLSQNGAIIYTHVFYAQPGQHGIRIRIPPGDVPLQRKQLHQRYRQRLGNHRRRLRRSGRIWRSVLQCPGLHAFRRFMAGHAHASVGHDSRRPGFVELAEGPSRLEVRRKLSLVYLADVGSCSEQRILFVHKRVYDSNGHQ
jgi:hypothetical protein